MRNLLLALVLILSGGPVQLVWGQLPEPVLHLSFEEGAALWEKNIQPADARIAADLQKPQFAPGISGQGLDLSAQAALRQPLALDESFNSFYGKEQSFSVQVWLRTEKGAPQDTPVLTNKKANEPQAAGWQISAQTNGAWALNLSDSNTVYNYLPTERQRINDGRWHHIVVVIDREIGKALMYYDGRNVAIYNITGLGDLSSNFRTVVGGSDQYFEWSSYGQWNSFNGYLDEVKIWDTSLTQAQIGQTYHEFRDESAADVRPAPRELRVMSWNIWHGGHRYGQIVGLQRVIEIIKSSQADIIFMQETYGSGAIIADSLGYYFYLISTNLSIMSRFPFVQTTDVFRPFNSGGATIQLSEKQQLALFCIWLHYLPDYSGTVENKTLTPEQLIAAEDETRWSEIRQILAEIQPQLGHADETPVLMGGDFNSGSHLDWIESTMERHNGYQVAWPVSKAMETAGFTDSYRKAWPNPNQKPGITWTPRAGPAYGLTDRIDYIYYKGRQLEATEAIVIDSHPVQFPSDHAAVVSVFHLSE